MLEQVDHLNERYHRGLFPLSLTLLLGVTWLLYAPGLHGGFLFDDYANLPALGATGPVNNWPAFWRYITSGIADPTGRPLAMLSFLLDARDWPADALPFKRSNVILHLLNGALLSLLLRRLGRLSAVLDDPSKPREIQLVRIDLAALLGAGLWLMHPLLVSTTLYIVQREAMLSTTFVLLGLLAWLHGRMALRADHRIQALLWMIIGLVGCTLLGLLSKANGVLLPALAMAIDCTVLYSADATRTTSDRNRRQYLSTMALLAWLPTALLAAYLVEQGWRGLVDGISLIRPWTLGQRLLTEPRVLMDYMHLLWLPQPFTPGLFNDQIRPSTSLWSPASTFPSLLAVFGIVIGAWLGRRRYPAWALAALFYFVGQLLESTTIPLELYFEHRNYLPAMFMFWPLAQWLCGTSSNPNPSSERARNIVETDRFSESRGTPGAATGKIAPAKEPMAALSLARPYIAMTLLAGLGVMTYSLASLWGNTRDQIQLWALLNPDSPRAQSIAAGVDMDEGHPRIAIARLKPALAREPNQAQLAMNLFDAECQLGQVDKPALAQLDGALRATHDPGTLLANWFANKMDQISQNICPELTFQTIATLLDAAASNPSLNSIYGRRQDIFFLRGRLALLQNDSNTALLEFNSALDQDAEASLALEQAALLGEKGFPRLALAHLDHYETVRNHAKNPSVGMARLHTWVLQHQLYWPRELAHLRDTLTKDAYHEASAVHESCKPGEKNCAQ